MAHYRVLTVYSSPAISAYQCVVYDPRLLLVHPLSCHIILVSPQWSLTIDFFHLPLEFKSQHPVQTVVVVGNKLLLLLSTDTQSTRLL